VGDALGQGMTISGNYPTPVYVNGYACNNCAQVAEAKKDINPADPQAGPGGINANGAGTTAPAPAVILGGVLVSSPTAASPTPTTSPNKAAQGSASAGQPFAAANPAAPPSASQSGLGNLLDISI
jgi:hypothetical protein